MEDCIFCKIIRGEIPSIKVYEDERVFVFMDINPIRRGHTLLIPKAHAENIWDIAADDLAAIHRVSKQVAGALRSTLNPAGVAVLQLNGRAVNQLVMHYHLHLIPRMSDDPPLTMTEWELKPGDMDLIRRTGDDIAAALG
jgi:histidine triad (HIT) family protein